MNVRQLKTDNDRRLAEASRWFVRHSALEDFSAADWHEWEQWSADPRNSTEFEALASMKARLKAMPAPELPGDDELLADVNQAVWAWMPWAAAAMLVVCAALAWQWMANGLPWKAGSNGVYTTQTGKHRQLSLPDGSSVAIGAGSEVSVRYSEHERLLILKQGEALFTVARQPSRPFRVQAGEGSITALGTTFNVLSNSKQVVVSVTEGAVAVAPQLSAPAVRVDRGQQAAFAKESKAAVVNRADVQAAVAWQRGTLVYRRRALAEVVEDVQRYTDRRVSVEPGAGDLLYSGTIGQQHIGAWIHELPRIFPVEVMEGPGAEIVIRQRR